MRPGAVIRTSHCVGRREAVSKAATVLSTSRVMPITPLARRCESSWLLISSTTICRFTAGRIRFCQYVSAGPKIHGLVGHDRLQPPVLFLELAQPAHFRHLQTAVLAAPGVERRVRDPVRGYSSAIFAPPSASFRIVMICSSRSRAGLMLAFVPRQTYRDTSRGEIPG
jgi:hypothetical protein